MKGTLAYNAWEEYLYLDLKEVVIDSLHRQAREGRGSMQGWETISSGEDCLLPGRMPH